MGQSGSNTNAKRASSTATAATAATFSPPMHPGHLAMLTSPPPPVNDDTKKHLSSSSSSAASATVEATPLPVWAPCEYDFKTDIPIAPSSSPSTSLTTPSSSSLSSSSSYGVRVALWSHEDDRDHDTQSRLRGAIPNIYKSVMRYATRIISLSLPSSSVTLKQFETLLVTATATGVSSYPSLWVEWRGHRIS